MEKVKFISGGQIGADIAGLRAAKKLGFETGGWIPRGFRTMSGFHPEYAEMYGLIETNDGGYPERTRLNVQNSDMTIRFAINWETPGERLTKRLITVMQKPSFDVHLYNDIAREDQHYIREFIDHHNLKIINIAGNARQSIESYVEQYLIEVFS